MWDLRTIAHVWPGLPRLWQRGSWTALSGACLFGLLLNFALVSNYICPEYFPRSVRLLAWVAVAADWWLEARRAWWRARQGYAHGDVGYEGLFIQAQAEYLRGHWYEAEAVLRTMLRRVPEDDDARLLLATLLRRTGRRQEARKELRRLAGSAGAFKWELELARERELLGAGDSTSTEPVRSNGRTETIHQRGTQGACPTRTDDARGRASGGEPTAEHPLADERSRTSGHKAA